MAYAHTNSKGNTYYLHSNGRMFFFSKEIKEGASRRRARRLQRGRNEDGHARPEEESGGSSCFGSCPHGERRLIIKV